jgi:hypothetical protein
MKQLDIYGSMHLVFYFKVQTLMERDCDSASIDWSWSFWRLEPGDFGG